MDIRKRIIEFLKVENVSSANFAQEIGVQPSGISHIISGRNKPSLDFILKMLNRYPSLSAEWLLFGKGQMLTESITGDLFSNEPNSENNGVGDADLFEVSGKSETSSFKERVSEAESGLQQGIELSANASKATRIVIFYSNNTFREYFPG